MTDMNSYPEYVQEAMAKGFVFECGCGEIYRTAEQAWGCRKCRDYLLDEDFYDRKVTDLRTGQHVGRPE